MTDEGEARGTRRKLIAAVFLVPIVLAAALWLPAWWEHRQLHEAQSIAGVGSQMVPGTLTDARKKIDPGVTGERIVAAIGKPSFKYGAQGASLHEIWTYYFHDGTLTINLTDGAAVRIATEYGHPRIPRSTRPGEMGWVNESR